MGVATCQEVIDRRNEYPTKFDIVLNNADFALNIAKKSHDQQIVFFSKEIEDEHRKKRKLSDQLAHLITSTQQNSSTWRSNLLFPAIAISWVVKH